MDTPRDNPQQALLEALDNLEACVETPFVPGELERWIGSVDDAWQPIPVLLARLASSHHPDQFAKMRDEDDGLIRRIELMREEDQKLDKLSDEFGQRIPQLETAIANIEPDEALLNPALDAFVDEALNLIIRIRTQEQTVRTWLLEAFNRDRGTVD